MKKLIFLLLLLIPGTIYSQGLFRPVSDDMFSQPMTYTFMAPMAEVPVIKSAWKARIDGTIQLSEVLYNKALKQLESNTVLGIGPAIGMQHYVPDAEGKPFNNYGFGAGVLLGEQMKFVLQANLMQYFKFGLTVTPKPRTDIFPVGLFFGGGITF